MKKIFTLGTSNREIKEFLEILKAYKIRIVVDVRRWPTSKFPHFKKVNLKKNLEKEKIEYFHLENLGGYREEGYKAYTKTKEFQKGLLRLENLAKKSLTCIICSERLPWKCHRAYIAQELSSKNWAIEHIIEKERIWQPEIEKQEIKPKCEKIIKKKGVLMPEEKEIGKITHYFTNISVGVIKLKDELKVGDEIHIKGATTDFTQKVDSMQIEHENVEKAKKGDSIGLKVSDRVREGDVVYKIESE